MEKSYTPTNARKNLYQIIKDVTTHKEPVNIVPTKNGEAGVTLIPTEDWEAMQETLYLQTTGVLETIQERMSDDSGFSAVDDVWNEL